MKICKNLSENVLLKFGFRVISPGKYILSKNLYKDIIYVKFIINTNDENDEGGREMDFDVIDRNTQQSYHPFYHNVNACPNLVAEEVKKNFNKIIFKMENSNIVKKGSTEYV